MNKDITFCTNDQCDQIKECGRSLSNLKSNANSYLSVAMFFPDENNYCNYFIQSDSVNKNKKGKLNK